MAVRPRRIGPSSLSFRPFGPERGDGLGVALLEGGGEVVRRLEDSLPVRLAGRALGDRSILGLRLAGDPEAGAEKAADGDEARKPDSHGVKPFQVANLADERGLADGQFSRSPRFLIR